MPYQNNLRQITNILYRLKRQYGLSLVLWHPTSSVSDVTTGAIVSTYDIQYIRRAIVLSTKLSRDFVYDLSYIAANKNFTYGGYFDDTRRFVIIDTKELNDDFEITPQDFIGFQSKFYNVSEVAETEDHKGFLIVLKEIAASDDFESDYTISGTLTPDWTGEYYANGKNDDDIAYQEYKGRYWIWWETANTRWVISLVKGITGTDYWERVDTNIVGDYTVVGAASGTASVAAS